MNTSKSACKTLVLDAGPLLSLSPLRGLAERFLTVPQVLSELKDKNAREHFERLGMSAGVNIEVKEPDALSLARVIQTAKKTGDYSVLSHADLCVLALTLALDVQEKAEASKIVTSEEKECETQAEPSQAASPEIALITSDARPDDASASSAQDTIIPGDSSVDNAEESNSEADGDGLEDKEPGPPTSNLEEELDEEFEREPLDVALEPLDSTSPTLQNDSNETQVQSSKTHQEAPLFEDPSDEDDGEGDWITPTNVGLYKSRALDLLPSSDHTSDPFTVVSNKKGKANGRRRRDGNAVDSGPREQIPVGCMTADFAMQNVLLQMGLSLVGLEGKRIEKVKTWVLRCHACFKICKDSTKKFCPTCGNPTLLRTSVTAKAPTADDSTPALEIHLKKNFAYRTRGTIYSIPAPKPGSSKAGNGEGLILREDQAEYMRAKKRVEGKKEREDRKLLHNVLEAAKSGGSTGVKIGSWMDPDWVPEMLSVGTGGKGRRAPDSRVSIGADGMPVVGYGRKNPNEKRRK